MDHCEDKIEYSCENQEKQEKDEEEEDWTEFLSQDTSMFDDCKLTNVKLYLNLDFYPYDMNLDFNKNKIAELYNIYSRFRKVYYGSDNDEALLILCKFLLTARSQSSIG
ncbi:hypothetical protein RF55_10897, partial [Lasius niger]